MASQDFSQLRIDYTGAELDEEAAGFDPLALFEQWMKEAIMAGLYEPNAMALATATIAGVPSVRTVLLKALDARGAVFYTNYESRKGMELSRNPRVAAVLLWHPVQRQVRLEGTVSRLSSEESDAYFASRPIGAQYGAMASPQSQTVADRGELEKRMATVEHAGHPVRPEHWGGYRIAIDSVEFWQGRSNRLHDRILFRRDGRDWLRSRLAP